MNLPNKLTVTRIILVPFFLIFLLVDSIQYRYIISCGIFLLAAITDHFDGKIARKYNLVTDFGRFADPLADKILVMSAFICFIELDILSAVPVIIILSREFIVTSIRLIAAQKGEVVAANIFGKIKTFTQMLSIIVILFIRHLYDLILNGNLYLEEFFKHIGISNVFYTFNVIEKSLVWVCVLFTLISGIVYIYDNRKFISST